ncbi:MAG: hypothetical protein HYV63_24635 [Candidatus Schekmanbacteria bacterium]|nr:hypothetical protein [Candidatus Schekmanbacteria bacterium]
MTHRALPASSPRRPARAHSRGLALVALALLAAASVPAAATAEVVCIPNFRYPDMRAAVGDAVQWTPVPQCLGDPRLVARSFKLLPTGNGPYASDYRPEPGRGLQLSPATGALNGTITPATRTAADEAEDDLPGEMEEELFLRVRMCYGPTGLATILKSLQFPSRYLLKGVTVQYRPYSADLVTLPATAVTTAKDVVYKFSGHAVAGELEGLTLSAVLQTEILLINGIPYTRAAESASAVAEPVESLRSCRDEPVPPGFTPREWSQMCTYMVQRDVAACNSASDADRCVDDAAHRNAERPWACAPGQQAFDGAVRISIVDEAPLRVAEPYSTDTWLNGVLENRPVTIEGGTGPGTYTYRVERGSLPASVQLDARTGTLSGRLDANTRSFNVTIAVSDRENRRLLLRASGRLDGTDVIFRACDRPDFSRPCLTISAPPAHGHMQEISQIRDLTAIYWSESNGPMPADQAVPNDRISSLWVAPGYEATVFHHIRFGGGYTTFRGGPRDLTGNAFHHTISSIDVRPIVPARLRGLRYDGASPDHSERHWAQGVQGIAHDERSWYMTSVEPNGDSPLPYVFKFAGNSIGDWQRRIEIPSYWDNYYAPICDHVGDPDFADGLLLVPADGCSVDGDDRPRIFAYDSDLRYQGAIILDGVDSAPLIAVDPHTGYFLVKKTNTTFGVFEGPVSRKLHGVAWVAYDLQLAVPAGQNTYGWIQGAEFSPSGKLYMIAENLRRTDGGDDFEFFGVGPGIFIFNLHGNRAVLESRININRYDPEWDGTSYRFAELEGLTIWDRPDAPYRGQIHYLALENEPGDDDGTLHHVTLDLRGSL